MAVTSNDKTMRILDFLNSEFDDIPENATSLVLTLKTDAVITLLCEFAPSEDGKIFAYAPDKTIEGFSEEVGQIGMTDLDENNA